MKSSMLLLRVTEGWNETEETSTAINHFLGRRRTWRCVGPRENLWPVIQSQQPHLSYLLWCFQNCFLSACLPPPNFCSLPERFTIPINPVGQTVPANTHLWAPVFNRRETILHLPYHPLHKHTQLIRALKPLRNVGSSSH